MFILDFNLVLSISFVTCGRWFAYVDRHLDTCPIETVLMTKLMGKTNLCKRWKRKGQN
jgi:hypothetical protein